MTIRDMPLTDKGRDNHDKIFQKRVTDQESTDMATTDRGRFQCPKCLKEDVSVWSNSRCRCLQCNFKWVETIPFKPEEY